MTYKFVIYGRGLGRESENPMGYMRTTVGSKWDPKYVEYIEWCGWVRSTFEAAFPEHEMQRIQKKRGGKYYSYAWTGKGLHIQDRFYLRTFIYFVNNVRADASNITKSIADALFLEDKQVLEQSLGYDFDINNPRVEVEIQFTSEQQRIDI